MWLIHRLINQLWTQTHEVMTPQQFEPLSNLSPKVWHTHWGPQWVWLLVSTKGWAAAGWESDLAGGGGIPLIEKKIEIQKFEYI